MLKKCKWGSIILKFVPFLFFMCALSFFSFCDLDLTRAGSSEAGSSTSSSLFHY